MALDARTHRGEGPGPRTGDGCSVELYMTRHPLAQGVRIDRVERGPDHVGMSLRYRVGADEWVHHFIAVPLGDEQVRACLSVAKFDAPVWINARWGCAAKNAV